MREQKCCQIPFLQPLSSATFISGFKSEDVLSCLNSPLPFSAGDDLRPSSVQPDVPRYLGYMFLTQWGPMAMNDLFGHKLTPLSRINGTGMQTPENIIELPVCFLCITK